MAMIAIYQKIGPWGPEWDLHDVMTWAGVEATWDKEAQEYRIVKFDYRNGNFHGTIPEEFKQLTELKYLGLGGGELTGEIPQWIGELKKLEGLYLGDNNLIGNIPPEIGNLSNLKDLMIASNQMTGFVPKEIGRLKKLQRLTIYGTNIGGEIPKELKDLSELRILDLKRNKFSGTFPIEIVGSRAIDCSFNCIDELPLEIWKIDPDVVGFPDLQHNNLHGELPEWIFETKAWKSGCYSMVERQNEGFGYDNLKN